ncbi:MAG: BCCT family transporter [Intestinibacter bartlettii]|nr:BCCT family transporter [Intestinibacter bartlettii]
MKDNIVFIVSMAISSLLVIWGVIDGSGFSEIANKIYLFLENNFSWFYLIVTFFLVVFCIYLGFGKFGNIKLGPEDSKPEFKTTTWFAMLFCAGMGVGLVFWSISEPLAHYINPIEGITPLSKEAMNFSIKSCFMHWGVHPWSLYAVVGLGLAYFQYKKNKPALISSLLEPIIGESRVNGFIGKMVDIFSTVLTVIGVSTSLGMACMQICEGLNYLFGIEINVKVWIILIVIVACIYIMSSVSGLNKGMTYLSNINIFLAICLLIIAFCIGPMQTTLKTIVNGVGLYISNFVSDSLKLDPYGENIWIYTWRVFYWAWWITWSPFVGVFIARISKGRTIREFVAGVILVPSIACMIWFGVFGSLALNVVNLFSIDALTSMAVNPETALYIIFNKYSIGTLLSIISIIVLLIFFITSADSAIFVIGMMSSKGDLNPKNYRKILWGIILALFAIILLITGGLDSVKTISVAASFPFLFILIAICISIQKVLSSQIKIKDKDKKKSLF